MKQADLHAINFIIFVCTGQEYSEDDMESEEFYKDKKQNSGNILAKAFANAFQK